MKLRRLFLLLLFLLPQLLYGGTVGKIKGKVTDSKTGEPLTGANVVVAGTTQGATSDVNGEYVIQNLSPGIYNLKVSFIGYRPTAVSEVRVNADLTTEQNIQLADESLTTSTIEVIAQKPLITKDNTNAVRITTGEDVKTIPVRGVDNIVGLTAGVVIHDKNIVIRGGRIDEVGYYLEGVSVTNPMVGGRGVTISQDAIEEIQVQAGGYTAEFGGANSGIIRQALKTGSQDIKGSIEYITDNISFKSKDNFFNGKKTLGAYSYGYNELSAVLSGPIIDPRYKFFANIDYVYNRDANPQPYPGANLGLIGDAATGDTINLVYPAGPVKGNQSNVYTYTGTLNMDLKPVILRFSGTYSTSRADVIPALRRTVAPGNLGDFLTNRIGYVDGKNGSFNLKLTHILSPTTFYEVSGGYFYSSAQRMDPFLKENFWLYGDSVANANAGAVWYRTPKETKNGYWGRYNTPSGYNIMGFRFSGINEVTVNHAKNKRESINFTGALSFNLNNIHSIKLGGEFTQYTIRNWNVGVQSQFAALLDKNIKAGMSEKDAKEAILTSQGVDNYGYDLLGNETNSKGLYAPHKPILAAAYIQDKIEYEDIILNLGLRFDYINIDNKMFKDPRRPELSIDPTTGRPIEDGFVNAASYSSVSPRIGFSFPVTDATVFHAQWGKFIQQSRLTDSYLGYTRQGFNLRGGYFIAVPIGQNLRPTSTTQYEIGFSQRISDYISFDITGYYKDVKDQVVFTSQEVDRNSPFQSYTGLTNGDFATTKGLEFAASMRRFNRVSFSASLSLQDARGTGSYPNSNRGIVGSPVDGTTVFNPVYISPLEFNNSLRGNANIDYRFDENDGPSILHNFGASILISFNSGHPFTRGTGSANLEGDARTRIAIEPLNASSTPPVYQVDLKIDKSFKLFDKLSANIYLYVINIFDRRNVENVFLRTGSATDDGYISNPELSAKLIESYGKRYVELYNAMNIDYYEQYQQPNSTVTTPRLFGPPRQIRLGIRLEY
ncbi:MAG: carboxypeptidase regulatory-like domain-containing protein [Bacillota bacterium]